MEYEKSGRIGKEEGNTRPLEKSSSPRLTWYSGVWVLASGVCGVEDEEEEQEMKKDRAFFLELNRTGLCSEVEVMVFHFEK